MSKSPVHFADNDTWTACHIKLWGTSHHKAPSVSSNPEHTTCPACLAARATKES